MDECEDISMWINNLVDYYPSFSEGWGLYSENPILLEDVDLLKDDGFSKYGALKWQVKIKIRYICVNQNLKFGKFDLLCIEKVLGGI